MFPQLALGLACPGGIVVAKPGVWRRSVPVCGRTFGATSRREPDSIARLIASISDIADHLIATDRRLSLL